MAVAVAAAVAAAAAAAAVAAAACGRRHLSHRRRARLARWTSCATRRSPPSTTPSSPWRSRSSWAWWRRSGCRRVRRRRRRRRRGGAPRRPGLAAAGARARQAAGRFFTVGGRRNALLSSCHPSAGVPSGLLEGALQERCRAGAAPRWGAAAFLPVLPFPSRRFWLRILAVGGLGAALCCCAYGLLPVQTPRRSCHHGTTPSKLLTEDWALCDAPAGLPLCMRGRGLLRGECWHPSSR